MRDIQVNQTTTRVLIESGLANSLGFVQKLPVCVSRIVKHFGLRIVWSDSPGCRLLPARRLAAFDKERREVILAKELRALKDPSKRISFATAHEIAHAVMHPMCPQFPDLSFVHDSGDSMAEVALAALSPSKLSPDEESANLFACLLLVPFRNLICVLRPSILYFYRDSWTNAHESSGLRDAAIRKFRDDAISAVMNQFNVSASTARNVLKYWEAYDGPPRLWLDLARHVA